MTACGTINSTFRLLDYRVGWDAAPGVGLDGVTLDGDALRLIDAGGADLPAGVVPAWLAWSGELRTWWLATECGLAALGPCDDAFVVWRRVAAPIVAVAARRRLVAVARRRHVEVFDAPTGALVGEFEHGTDITAIGISPGGRVVVADGDGGVTLTDLSGLHCAGFTVAGVPSAVAFGCDDACTTFIVHSQGLEAVPMADGATDAALDTTACGSLPGVDVGPGGFCIDGRGCFDWCGCPADRDEVMRQPAPPTRRGQYLSAPLDSGIDRCRWHRVRIDAELPAGTSLELAAATTDGPVEGRPPAPVVPGSWDAFPAGEPDPSDWQSLGENVTDALLRLPPGRHAYVRIRLASTSAASPVVHQVRIDLPRSTTANVLPAVYAADPLAHDFTERFLANFDAHIELLDDVLDGRDALLDPDALPDDALTWLAGLLGTGFEAVMMPDRRRVLIRHLPDLYRRRGTPGGLADLVTIALGADITVEELSRARPWGAVDAAHLGRLRLFGRSSARVRLGASELGQSVMQVRGNPDDDARLSGASRIRVHVVGDVDRPTLERVVRSQIPAHVVADLGYLTHGFRLTSVLVGVGTVLSPLPPPIVGTTRLGRDGVLRRGRRGAMHVVGHPVPREPSHEREHTCAKHH